MSRKVLVINAHPDASVERLSAALADAYARGAQRGGHEVRRLVLADLDFSPVLNSASLESHPPDAIRNAQEAFVWAEHITIVFPLWLGAPPAMMKGFFEQLCRYGFAFDHKMRPLLKGRSARLIVTMLIPTLVFHLLFSQGIKGFVRSVLSTAGIRPTRILPLGNVLAADKSRWLAKVEALGSRGA